MANYTLTVNSQFDPFSYQELLQPALMATQAHRELEDQYAELSTKAGVWENLANKQTDPYAYNMYKTYANDLEAQAAQLAREGLNPTSRKSLIGMKSRYSKEIVPIEQAYTARQKQAEEQQKALLQDPTLMLSRRAATTSLDDYIKNPQLAYESYSGKLLTSQAAAAASALSKEMQEHPRKWRNILEGRYYETMMRKGFSPDEVLKAVQGNPEAAKELTKIVSDVIDSSGISQWADANILREALGHARRGLWSAVGETTYQTLQNQGWTPEPTAPAYTPVDLRGNPYNLDVVNELYGDRETHDKYAKFFDKNGNLTKEGMEVYNTESFSTMVPNITGTAVQHIASKSPFAYFIDGLTGRQNLSKEEIEQAYRENAKRFKPVGDINADVIRNTAFNVTFKSDFGIEDLIGRIPSNITSVPTYKYTKEGYKESGTIDLTDTKFQDAVISGEYGNQGNFIVITTKKGDRYKVPLGAVHQPQDAAIKSTFEDISNLYLNSKGESYSDEELDRPIIIPGSNKITTRRDLIKERLNTTLDNYSAAFEEVQTEPYKVTGGLH